MKIQKLLPVAIATVSIFAAVAVQAAAIVTIDPQANNGGAGVVDATEPAFNTTGFLGSLGSVLDITGSSGVQFYTETGRIQVSDWQLGNVNLNTNVASTYDLYADFTLTGAGQWISAANFIASPFGNVLTFSFGADINNDGTVDIALGTGTLNNGFPSFAFVTLGGASSALTGFSATVDFTPAVGTEGVGGFFRAPTPFSIDIFAGSVGGSFNDTTYVTNGDGSISITTVGGSGNFDFVNQVPEPSSLALFGLALAGAGFASRRKERAQV
jgi:hypothetical protein